MNAEGLCLWERNLCEMKAPDKLSDVLTLPNSSGMKAQRWNKKKKDKKSTSAF